MRKTVLLFLSWMAVASLMAQDRVVLRKSNGGEVGISAYAVDTMVSTPELQRIHVSYPNTGEVSFSYSPTLSESEVDLSRTDRPQSDNLLYSVRLPKAQNPSLQRDLVIDASGKRELSAVVAPGTLLPDAAVELSASATFVYVNGRLWKQGDKVDLSQKAELKLVAHNGDVRTYTLELKSSQMAQLSVTTAGAVGLEWSPASSLKLDSKSHSGASIKGNGKHFAEGLKNNFRIKFEEKAPLLDMIKNKRWALVSLDGDKTMMRAALAYDIAASMKGLAWTPNYRRVEFFLNGAFMGHYLLVEQVRVCKGRLADGYAVSIQDAYDEGDDFFRSERSDMLFVMKDPETGLNGTGLIRTKDRIDAFEEALFSGGGFSELADIQSFADYYLLNEIAKDEDAFVSDCYMNLRQDGTISMGPVWNLGKSFGAGGASAEGFVADRSPWFEKLNGNSSFRSLVKSRFDELYARKGQLLQSIDELAQELIPSVAGNEVVWDALGAKSDDLSDVRSSYMKEVDDLKRWLDERLEWMKSHLE